MFKLCKNICICVYVILDEVDIHSVLVNVRICPLGRNSLGFGHMYMFRAIWEFTQSADHVAQCEDCQIGSQSAFHVVN